MFNHPDWPSINFSLRNHGDTAINRVIVTCINVTLRITCPLVTLGMQCAISYVAHREYFYLDSDSYPHDNLYICGVKQTFMYSFVS